VTDFLSNRGID